MTYAGLRIYDDELDPERITSLLGIEPSGTQVRGRAQTTSIGGIGQPGDAACREQPLNRVIGPRASKIDALR